MVYAKIESGRKFRAHCEERIAKDLLIKKYSKNSDVVLEKGNWKWFLRSAVINPAIKLRLICTPPETDTVIGW